MFTASGRTRLLLIGSSGHASVLVETIKVAGEYEIAGFLDDTQPVGFKTQGYAVLGTIAEIEAICARDALSDVVIAIGDNWQRRRVLLDILDRIPNAKFPVIRHPSSVISSTADVNKGTVILANAHIGTCSRVGEFCIINTASSIDHDCEMADFSSIAPGVSMGGRVRIGECSAVGVGASISNQVSIGNHTVVGTGAVVVRDIPDFAVAYGNPAQVRRKRAAGEGYF